MSSLLEMTLVELVDALARRRASPVELMHETLARTRATAERLNAIVARRGDDDLLADARAAEARIARGHARPLEGVPFGVKDLEDAAGLPTTFGSLAFRDARPATRESTQVARLRGAGAILFGKTNAPEFGHTAITKNLVFGATLSPWDAARSPGGSSGGSAAAIAGEVLPLATASDGGGSIRIPASFVGAFGLKPSFGRVPVGPMLRWDHGATAVYGPLTKTVDDAAFLLDLVAGPDAGDPRSLPPSATSFVDAVRRPLARGLRIAYSPDFGRLVVQSDIAATVAAAARAFEELGCTVDEIRGGPADLTAQWALINAFELGGNLARVRAHREGDLTRSLVQGIRMAENIGPRWWGEFNKLRAELVAWVAGVFDEHDLLLTPTAPFDPPPAKGPFPTETEGKPQPLGAVAAFTIPFNLSWNPAASVRAGLSRAGLPVGLHIVGPQHGDALVLQAARAFERVRPWHPRWPLRAG